MSLTKQKISLKSQQTNMISIIENFNQGNLKELDKIINQLNYKELDSTDYCGILRSLDEVASAISMEFGRAIIPSILRVNWYERETYVIKEFTSFITGFLAVHNCHLPVVLLDLVKLFLGGRSSSASHQISDGWGITKEQQRKDAEIFNVVHNVLQEIIRKIPEAVKSVKSERVSDEAKPLVVAFKQAFPVWRRSSYQIGCYVYNVFRLMPSVPTIRPLLLELVIGKILLIDSQLDTEQLIEEDEVQFTKLDLEDSSLKRHSVDCVLLPPCESSNQETLAVKLDLLLHLLLKYIHSACFSQHGDLDGEKTKSLFKQLLDIFDRRILTVDSPCQIQFCMFYICSFHEDLSTEFIRFLWDKVQDESLGYNVRQTSAWYLTDFLARGKFVSVDTLMTWLSHMCFWCGNYVRSKDKNTNVHKFEAHKVFHSLCLSTFFLLMYRHAEILDDELLLHSCRKLGIQTLVNSPHNPLKFGEANFLALFSRTMRAYDVALCDAAIENNNQKRLLNSFISSNTPSSSSWNGEGQGSVSKYPFEKYFLKLTMGEIEPLIRDYSEGKLLANQSRSSQGTPVVMPRQHLSSNDSTDDVAMCSVSPPTFMRNVLLSSYGQEIDTMRQRDVIIYGDSRTGPVHF